MNYNNSTPWLELSMLSRLPWIRMAVSQGITNIDEIHKFYEDYNKNVAGNILSGEETESLNLNLPNNTTSFWKDVAYRIMSLKPKESRNIEEITDAITNTIQNMPIDYGYTGSWLWKEDSNGNFNVQPNPEHDLNWLFMYGNTKGQFKPITKEEYRGHNYGPFLAKNYPNKSVENYYGNFVPANKVEVVADLAPVVNYLAKHDIGIYSDAMKGGFPDFTSEAEGKAAIKNGWTAEDSGTYRIGFGYSPEGKPEIQFSDLIDFGGGYKDKWGTIAGIQGNLLNTVGNPVILRQYTPIEYVSDREPSSYGPEAAIMEAARKAKLAWKDSEDEYTAVAPMREFEFVLPRWLKLPESFFDWQLKNGYGFNTKSQGGNLFDGTNTNSQKLKQPWKFQLPLWISKPIMELGRHIAVSDPKYYPKLREGESSTGTPQDTYMMDRWDLRKRMLDTGYILGVPNDYGLVRSAVGNRTLPVYQTAPDDVLENEVSPIGNIDLVDFTYWGGNPKAALVNNTHSPSTLYIDKDLNVYLKAWDLNDLGEDARGFLGFNYGSFKNAVANWMDKHGAPTVINTGISKVGTLSDIQTLNPDLANKISSANLPQNDGYHTLIGIRDAINDYVKSKGLQVTDINNNGLEPPELVLTPEIEAAVRNNEGYEEHLPINVSDYLKYAPDIDEKAYNKYMNNYLEYLGSQYGEPLFMVTGPEVTIEGNKKANGGNLLEDGGDKNWNQEIRNYIKKYKAGKYWSDSDIKYLENKLHSTGWDPESLLYVMATEASFNPTIASNVSSAKGLAQITDSTFLTLYPATYKSILNQYKNGTRTTRLIIDDAFKYYDRIDRNIKTDRDLMTYGRLKMNMLSPARGLKDVIDAKELNRLSPSLTKDQRKYLEDYKNYYKKDPTYRLLITMYDEGFRTGQPVKFIAPLNIDLNGPLEVKPIINPTDAIQLYNEQADNIGLQQPVYTSVPTNPLNNLVEATPIWQPYFKVQDAIDNNLLYNDMVKKSQEELYNTTVGIPWVNNKALEGK